MKCRVSRWLCNFLRTPFWLGVLAAAVATVPQPGRAGTVWLSGSDWLGGEGVSVYSKYSSDVGQRSYYNGIDVGLKWQCVELCGRLYTKKGWRSGYFPNAELIYPNARSFGLVPHANGSGYVPVPGDMVTWDTGAYGHVAVVDYVTPTKVHIVEQNFSSTCKKTMTRSGTNGSHVERDDGWGYGDCQGFIHAPKNDGGTDDAELTAENYPDGSVLAPGETFTKTFTMKNNGTTTWGANGPNGYTLNHIKDIPASPNLGAAYQAIPTENVSPGESYVFRIPLTAPTTPGDYEADFRMNSSDSVYFGPKIWVKITVSQPDLTNDAAVVSLTAPSSVTAGQMFAATIVMRNTGSRKWTSGGETPHSLGSRYPADNDNWGFSRVALPSSPITPSQTATFTFYPIAPVVPGTYTFAWKMVEEGVGWFGTTASQTITVVSSGNARYWDINGSTAGAGGASPGGAWTGNFWNATADGTGVPGGWSADNDAVFSAGTDATGFFKVIGIPNTSWNSVTIQQGQVQLEGGYVTNNGTSGTDGTTLIKVVHDAYLSMTNAPGIYLAGKGITKRGKGVLNLGGNEYYTGPTYIEQGTVTVVSDLPNKRPFGLGAPGTANATIHLLSSGTLSAGVPLPGNGTNIYLTNQYTVSLEGGAIEVGAEGSNFIVAAQITGAGTLLKQGAGFLILAGSNTFSGGAVISDGTLVANASGALGSGDVLVLAGSRLNLNGSYFNPASALLLASTASVTNAAPNTGAGLSFDGGLTFKRAGTWGSTASGAAFMDDTHFAGAGRLTVTSGPESFATLDETIPAIYGQPVTLTAHVHLVDGPLPAAGTPTGTVTFYDNGVPIGSPAAVTAGVATLSATTLALGDHTITATYSGDTTFAPSSAAAVTQTVSLAPTIIELSSSRNPSLPGANVTFRAVVTAAPPSAGTPVGQVLFEVNGLAVSTNALLDGAASASLNSLPAGTNVVIAQYTGNSVFEGSVDALEQVVSSDAPGDQVYLNEVLSNPPGSDTGNEYFELRGTPNLSLAGYCLISVEGQAGSGNSKGDINSLFLLDNLSLGANGYLFACQGASQYTVTNPATSVIKNADGHAGWGTNGTSTVAYWCDSSTGDFENEATTILLVKVGPGGAPPLLTIDLDTNDDGVLDLPAGWTMVDSVGIMDGKSAAATDSTYGAINFRAPGGAGGTYLGGSAYGNVIDIPGPMTTTAGTFYVGRKGESTGSTTNDWVGAIVDGTAAAPLNLIFYSASDPAYSGLKLSDMVYGGTNFGVAPVLSSFSITSVSQTLQGPRLEWSPAGPAGLNLKYVVYRSPNAADKASYTPIVTVTTTSYTDTSAPAAGAYYYVLAKP
ncbi:MAG TPA: Ig-like domain repeat protein [Candidatus Paceibacterota bacterium]|nr:Ig-like domain repeat protein [Verrucomicrobiota bacterium]HSA12372.1 Ig-like domain repeat protein [Candidatus Paceibacterota bacterium]